MMKKPVLKAPSRRSFLERQYFLGIVAAFVLTLGPAGLSIAAGAAPDDDENLTQGEVRRIDSSKGRITIRHEAIRSLQMSAMTMVFVAEDPALLENVREGQKIAFAARQQSGVLYVTRIVSQP